MTSDQLVGCVAIAAMLSLVLPRLARDRTPRNRMLLMALLWIVIIAVVTVVVMAMPKSS
ncbi:hypothetical protein [Rhizorhabdus argentea]|uniref:hypothetical protein n=1 Tax=Rhizorhabdus argentea TaxID=1387174 RepID=UPI0030ECAFEC